MTGMSQQDYADMMLKGGRSVKAIATSRAEGANGRTSVAKIIAGVAISHVPAVGAAIDNKTGEPYWVPVFKGFDRSKQWIADSSPTCIILVYNDHASAFSLEIIPTFALGCAAEFPPADEGWGPRPVPTSRAIRSSRRISPSR